ncbi:EF-hand domain-containing protein [Xylophilus sp. GOD-11R]|uniref:EF-hand domain-containing protein n=1 Tax=Xylophilus sp. GOD-11R TaxID=3089814 RepID=UPI00298BD53A|nr:EF-hand domain-containing protein [Xylophilus sp. GOD-11R]WPB57860.1 EF-hand domain-containing protein [Xylophilus sp. GOD-11R]
MTRFLRPALGAALLLSLCTAVSAQSQSTKNFIPLETIPGTASAPSAAEIGAVSGRSRGEALAAKQFGWLDTDHDGFLSREEVATFARLRNAFDQADTDKDNRVSLDEIRAFAEKRQAEKAAAAAPRPGAVVPADQAPAAAEPVRKARVVPPKEW